MSSLSVADCRQFKSCGMSTFSVEELQDGGMSSFSASNDVEHVN